MASFVSFHVWPEDQAEKVHNLGSDNLGLMLTNSAPNASTGATKADITQIANGNGYTTDGPTLTRTSSAQTSGTYRLIMADYTFTASGGSMGPFRYVVFYNKTADRLIGYWDYGSSITLADGETFVVDFDGTDGVINNIP